MKKITGAAGTVVLGYPLVIQISVRNELDNEDTILPPTDGACGSVLSRDLG